MKNRESNAVIAIAVVVVAIATMMMTGCPAPPRSNDRPAPAPALSVGTSSSSSSSSSRTELIIDATGYVTRISNGAIVLDAPPSPGLVKDEYTHYELPATSEVAKALNDALVKAEVREFPFLPKLRAATDLGTVDVGRLMFSTMHSDATRFSPIVATVRARVKHVVDDRSEDARFKLRGTTFQLEPIQVKAILKPYETTEVAARYRSSIGRAAATISWSPPSLNHALLELDDARTVLVQMLNDAAPAYEAFRFVDDLVNDLKKGVASNDPIEFAAALREHMSEDRASGEVSRPYLLDTERELIQRLDEWIHDQLAAALEAEKGATPRARRLAALVIKADNLKLGPRSAHDYLVPPRIVSTAAKNAHRRFPDLDPNQK